MRMKLRRERYNLFLHTHTAAVLIRRAPCHTGSWNDRDNVVSALLLVAKLIPDENNWQIMRINHAANESERQRAATAAASRKTLTLRNFYIVESEMPDWSK